MTGSWSEVASRVGIGQRHFRLLPYVLSSWLNPELLSALPAVWGMFVVNNSRMVMAEEAE